MHMLPHTLPGFELLASYYSTHTGAVVQAALFGRPDGTGRLFMSSNDPELGGDEEFELTKPEVDSYLDEEMVELERRPPISDGVYIRAVRVRAGGEGNAGAARSR